MGYFPFGVALKCSATINSGYKYYSGHINVFKDCFGTLSHKFRCISMWLNSFSNTIVRMGYMNGTSNLRANVGAYFELSGGALYCICANSSYSTVVAMTSIPSLNINYLFDIEVNAAGTEAVFKLTNAITGVLIETVTMTTNIPPSSSPFTVGFTAQGTATTAAYICILKYMGFGTVEGYNRARG
jgi:hypothetical protein